MSLSPSFHRFSISRRALWEGGFLPSLAMVLMNLVGAVPIDSIGRGQEAQPPPAVSPSMHRLVAQTPDELCELFRPTHKRLSFLSAHRGGPSAGFPENCLATFERTIQQTYSILEVDPRFTQDGVIVLHHDATLDRTTTGTGRLADRTWAEVKDLYLKDNEGQVTAFRIPRLDDVIQWAKGKTILVLDQKDVSTAERVKQITQHQAETHVMIIANTFHDARECYELNPNVMMEVMIPSVEKAESFDRLGIPWRNIVAFVGHDPPKEKALYEWIHRKGASCMIGTSRHLDRQVLSRRVGSIWELESEYRAFLQWGADIIETDIPTLLGPMILPSKEASR